MKKGLLIATFFLIIGFILEIMLFSNVFRGFTYAELIFNIQNSFYGAFIVVPYLSMIFFLMMSMGSKKVLLIIGSVLSILGLVAQLLGILTSRPPEKLGMFSTIYVLGTFVLVVGMLFYFIGCIMFRKQSKLGVFTGLFLFLIVLVSNLIISFIFIYSEVIPQALGSEISLYGALVQMVFFILHGFAFSFSKKKSDSWDDGEEDTMSVESGDAFASYVPSGKSKKEKTKKDKKKKKTKGDDDDFIFDF
jgi:hypothetical protein